MQKSLLQALLPAVLVVDDKVEEFTNKSPLSLRDIPPWKKGGTGDGWSILDVKQPNCWRTFVSGLYIHELSNVLKTGLLF